MPATNDEVLAAISGLREVVETIGGQVELIGGELDDFRDEVASAFEDSDRQARVRTAKTNRQLHNLDRDVQALVRVAHRHRPDGSVDEISALTRTSWPTS